MDSIEALNFVTAGSGYTLSINHIKYILMQSDINNQNLSGFNDTLILLDQIVLGLGNFKLSS